MPAVRRLYLYLVALVSLLALMAGLTGLAAGLAGLLFNALPWQVSATELAQSDLGRWAALVLVSLPLWAIHWYFANRVAAGLTMAGAVERAAAARKAYFYLGLLVALLASVAQGVWCLDLVLLRAFGAVDLPGGWPAGPAGLAAGAVVALLFWLYLRWAATRDGDAGHEAGAGAGWRRTYDYLAAALGTALLFAGAAEVLRVGVGLAGQIFLTLAGLPATGAWRDAAAISLAALLAGAPLALLAWRRADWIAADDPSGAEVNALGRKLLIYAGLLAGVAGSVLSAAYALMVITLLFLGQPVDNLGLLWQSSVAPALAYYAVSRMVWWAFGRGVRKDMDWAPESSDAATLRRVYFYLMAAITLAAFWYGLQQVLVTLLSLLVGVAPASILAASPARNSFSLAVALLIAAGPAWWWHWQRAQSWARQPGPAGYEERISTLRRLYLYGAAVASALVVIVALGVVIYHAPSWLLGPRSQPEFLGVIVQLGVAIALALTWWIGHGIVMREDTRLVAAETAEARAGQAGGAFEDEPPLPPAAGPAEVGPDEVGASEAARAGAIPARPAQDEGQGTQTLAARSYDRAGLQPENSPAAAQPPNPQTAQPGQPLPAASFRSPARAPVGQGHAVVIVDGGSGAAGALLLDALHHAFPALLLWPIGLNAAAQSAMDAALNGGTSNGGARSIAASHVPPDALLAAAAIVGPGDILVPGGLRGEMPPELAAAVADSPVRKVLLPPADPRLRWAGAPAWSLEHWVQQATAEVESILAGLAD